MVSREEGKFVRLTRADIVEMLKRDKQLPPASAKFVVVEVEKGDEVFNVNEVDRLVISWG